MAKAAKYFNPDTSQWEYLLAGPKGPTGPTGPTGAAGPSNHISPIDVSSSTAAATAAKVGTTTGGSYTPTTGDIILVTFTNSNTATNPTINIDGSGAKNILLGNVNPTAVGMTGTKVMMWYDGAAFQLFGSQRTSDSNTSYSEISEAEIENPASSTARLITGRRAEALMDNEASAARTLANKRITPRVGTVASSATPTPTGDSSDIYTITALATDATIASPSGTPTNGQKLILRIKDNGTARGLTWDSIYRAIGVTLPPTTTISKTIYIGMIYNSADTKWDVIAVGEEL